MLARALAVHFAAPELPRTADAEESATRAGAAPLAAQANLARDEAAGGAAAFACADDENARATSPAVVAVTIVTAND